MTYINAVLPGHPIGTRGPSAGASQPARAVAPGGSSATATAPGLTEKDAKLKQVVGQLEGVFVEQLFKAMRETVPTDGLTSGGTGEQMFAGLFDQQLATEVPSQWQHGIGESLLRQLRSRLAPTTDASAAAASAASASTTPDVSHALTATHAPNATEASR